VRELQPASQSSLATLRRCARKYLYEYVNGFKPKTTSEAMWFGTQFHDIAAHGYRAWKAAGTKDVWLEAALTYADNLIDQAADQDDFEVIAQLGKVKEVVEYFWLQLGSKDDFDEIVSVEEPVAVDFYGYKIRGTLDVVARKGAMLIIPDHKTMESVHVGYEFFPLDFQGWLYRWHIYKTKGASAMFLHNMIRREVPPGFGSRELRIKKDGTPAKNNASTDPADYLHREKLWCSGQELRAFESELENTLRILEFRRSTGVWDRSDLKWGAQSCGTCAYRTVCKAELAGHTISDSILTSLYDRVEDPFEKKPVALKPPERNALERNAVEDI